MTRPLEALDSTTLRTSLARNIPGPDLPLCPGFGMHDVVIGDEIARITAYPATDFVENHVRTYMSLIHPHDRERVERDV